MSLKSRVQGRIGRKREKRHKAAGKGKSGGKASPEGRFCAKRGGGYVTRSIGQPSRTQKGEKN